MMNEDFLDDSFYAAMSTMTSASSKRASELRLIDLEQVVDPIAEVESIQYAELKYHWFYTAYSNDKVIWLPLSNKDSANIENTYIQNINEIKRLRSLNELERFAYLKNNTSSYIVDIKGGRFEVDLIDLIKRPVYWVDPKKSEVKRCLWFYKENNEQRYLPYDEEYSEFLEKEYEYTIKNNAFHKRIDYHHITPIINTEDSNLTSQHSTSSEEAFVFHSTSVMLHFTQATMLDEFGNLNSDAQRPRIVKRGITEVAEKIEADENEKIDHLCFVVHGIGEGCDLKFRPIVDCVDDFRDIGYDITQCHLKSFIESNKINGRVEFLPISWHRELHGDPTGVDERLKPISLPSIPKLRQFSNSTILDVLFYTSPIYCQTIIKKVGNELNRLSQIFLERNPYFAGQISLVGHSLGSLILFDLLSNQIQPTDNKDNSDETDSQTTTLKQQAKAASTETLEEFLKRLDLTEFLNLFEKEKITAKNLHLLSENDLINIGMPLGPRKVLLNEFKNDSFRKEKEEIERKIQSNLELLRKKEAELTMEADTNNFYKHGLAGTGQLMVKYPQLNFRVAKFFALGSPIAMFQTVRGIERIDPEFKFPTCDEFFNIFHPFDPVAYRFEPLICANPILKPVLMPHHKGRKRMHIELREGLTKVGEDLKQIMYGQIKNAWASFSEFTKSPKPSVSMIEAANAENKTEIAEEAAETSNKNENKETPEETCDEESLCNFGKINKGKRIDYVLQERPIESFNEYLFALASHACYWESEDTLLLIIKELYGYENTVDANIEPYLTDQQQQQTSWLTQTAASAISSNVQKTFSYFSIGIPQSLTNISSVLPSSNK